LNHRIPIDLQQVSRLLIRNKVLIERHGISQLFLGRRGKSRGHCAEYRQTRKVSAGKQVARDIFLPKCLIEKLCNQCRDDVRGAKSSDGRKLAIAWHTLAAPGKGLHLLRLWVGCRDK